MYPEKAAIKPMSVIRYHSQIKRWTPLQIQTTCAAAVDHQPQSHSTHAQCTWHALHRHHLQQVNGHTAPPPRGSRHHEDAVNNGHMTSLAGPAGRGVRLSETGTCETDRGSRRGRRWGHDDGKRRVGEEESEGGNGW